MEKNYYDELLEQVDTLLNEKKYEEVRELLSEEVKMPYIPKKYEQTILDLYNEAKGHLQNNTTHNAVPRDIAIEYLLSEDENQESIALELLRDHNLRYDIEIFKKRIETWPISKNIMKAYLYELLVEQQIDIEINFNGMNMNPVKSGSILERDTVIEAMKEIQSIFAKNPSEESVALDEFQRFILMSYPGVPEDGKDIANDIANIVKTMFGEEIKLTEKQEKIKAFLSKK